ncbi:unnamed protein product [Dicrocoelium dendriticum]|nr:unnamed protein product [Dicrocoelium dendriticum]
MYILVSDRGVLTIKLMGELAFTSELPPWEQCILDVYSFECAEITTALCENNFDLVGLIEPLEECQLSCLVRPEKLEPPLAMVIITTEPIDTPDEVSVLEQLEELAANAFYTNGPYFKWFYSTVDICSGCTGS